MEKYKNWKKLKIEQKRLSQKQVKNVLDDASAELANLNNMIGSIIGNGRQPTCRGRCEFATQNYYAKILPKVH